MTAHTRSRASVPPGSRSGFCVFLFRTPNIAPCREGIANRKDSNTRLGHVNLRAFICAVSQDPLRREHPRALVLSPIPCQKSTADCKDCDLLRTSLYITFIYLSPRHLSIVCAVSATQLVRKVLPTARFATQGTAAARTRVIPNITSTPLSVHLLSSTWLPIPPQRNLCALHVLLPPRDARMPSPGDFWVIFLRRVHHLPQHLYLRRFQRREAVHQLYHRMLVQQGHQSPLSASSAVNLSCWTILWVRSMSTLLDHQYNLVNNSHPPLLITNIQTELQLKTSMIWKS